MPEPSKERQCPRFDVNEVDGTFVAQIDVTVLNLSAAGMAIETYTSLTVGQNYSFHISNNNVSVNVKGRVMWCVLGKTRRPPAAKFGPVFRAGIEFSDVLSTTVLELQKLIEDSAVLDPTEHIYGRFVKNLSGSVSVDTETEFEVKRLSMTGMLIDTQSRPNQDETVLFELRIDDNAVSGEGRVAYTQAYEPTADTHRFRLGIAFTVLTDHDRMVLEHYITELLSLQQQRQLA